MQTPDPHNPLLTINPKSGVVLFLLGGHVVPFMGLGQIEDFVEQLKNELDVLKLFVSDETAASIDNDYAQEVIASWEIELNRNKEATSQTTEGPDSNDPSIIRNPIAQENRYKKMSPASPTRQSKAVKKDDSQNDKRMGSKEIQSSKSRMKSLKRMASAPVPDDFDPDVISWPLDNLGITDWEGGLNAKALGYYVINVAEEIQSNADSKMPVIPPTSPSDVVATQNDVEEVTDLIQSVLDNGDQKVVVHCYMGMERSVLCVVRYMNKYLGMDLDQAYGEISKVRPIAADRRHWIGM